MAHEQCRESYTKTMKQVKATLSQSLIDQAEASTKSNKGTFKLGAFVHEVSPSCCNFVTRAAGWSAYMRDSGAQVESPPKEPSPEPIVAGPAPTPEPAFPESIQKQFIITELSSEFELRCRTCHKGWALAKTDTRRASNLLFLLNHARSHEPRQD
jgi:hypothetical protein